ncbi:MAG: class I SAM-dependent DNA methyltransferase, partial [Gemmataceae bacterium]
ANSQLFVTELCDLLDLPRPEPATGEAQTDAYVFERRVRFRHGDGSESEGRIDCYRRAAFILESKKVRADTESKRFDDALLRARSQAENYARALPATETRPPFLIVADVGRVIELYSEFSRSGATYTPFPDPRSHRIRLDDLAKPEIRERLRKVWLAPDELDPAKISARVTRAVADRLAGIARNLEAASHSAEQVAGFLTRCLFTFFAEDVGLLPKNAFHDLLKSLTATPAQFVPLVSELWQAMDKGGFSVAIRAEVKRFNGKLFKQPDVLPLNRAQIELLVTAAHDDWSQVEPAIIGTLLERALDPRERHKLGAHYTPRAYVERLVLPTVIEPLRADWANVQAAALTLLHEGKARQAESEIRRFHHDLCNIKVLDPACGSGNFLYVTLEHLKRLEGEVLIQLEAINPTGTLETQGLTVDPHQLLGIELNPRAAALAELVLWIGFLQWHFRTRGDTSPPLPVLKDYGNIQCCDAVLAYDRVEFVIDERGVPVTRWDGRTFKSHPATGEPVPDDTARTPQERYRHPRQAEWPQADFVVGNPPFIGASGMRRALGDGYAEALWAAWPQMPESADFVMFWWHHAATLARSGQLRRFGFITTNSIRQTFNRRVIDAQMAQREPLSIVFAIPDHPWVDSADGAAVRIAMTAGSAAAQIPGSLLSVIREDSAQSEDEISVVLAARSGVIHADLSIGANIASAGTLLSNQNLTSRGLMLFGAGFIVT